MRSYKFYIAFCLLVMILACRPQQKLYQLYKMDDFAIDFSNDFIKKIQYLPEIYEISLVDTRHDGNDFVVNKQSIFLDTIQQNQPNYYCYKKRAKELNVSEDSLYNCLKTFYSIGVNEFNRDHNYYRFPVVVGFTTNRGYLYSELENLQPGDTLPATSVRNRDYHFHVVLVKRIDKLWFEYYETS